MTSGHFPSILIYSRDPESWKSWLLDHASLGNIYTASTPEEARCLMPSAEIVLCGRVLGDLFAGAPRLRWVQSVNAGIEDLVGASSLVPHVLVTRVVDQFGGPIAEYVFAELLARARKVEELRELQMRQEWRQIPVGTLAGGTIGIAGTGSIGAEIARKARAFDMKVYGMSRTKAAVPQVDRHFGPDEWLDFVHDLRVLVLALPLTRETASAVNVRVLRAMRQDSILVNIGRGALIVETDLIRALREGRIGGAVLDVFEHEPLPADNPLWSLPNVSVTPHIAGPTRIDSVGRLFLENLRRYTRGEPLLGVVDRARGY